MITGFDVLVWSWVLIQIPFAVWVFRAQPPVAIWRQYSLGTRLRAMIPGTMKRPPAMIPPNVRCISQPT